jgi:hypothetical protein
MATRGLAMPWWQAPILLVINTKMCDFPLRHRCQDQSYSRESTKAVTPFVKTLLCLYSSSFSQVAAHLTAVLRDSRPADKKRP